MTTKPQTENPAQPGLDTQPAAAEAKPDLARKPETPQQTIQRLLGANKSRLAAALPRVGLTPDRMIRLAVTALDRSPVLKECDPVTICSCIIQSAQLGLDPSGVTGEAYLVPFRNKKRGRMEAQFIPGYKGLLKLARRSGEIVEVGAHVVHERDEFDFAYGLDSKLHHVPSTDKDPGDVVFAYAYAKFKGGGRQFEVMTLEQLEEVRGQSKASNNGPWVTHREEMQRKTVFRRLAKWLPMETELAKAIEFAAQEEQGLPQALDLDLGLDDDATPASLDTLADRMDAEGATDAELEPAGEAA